MENKENLTQLISVMSGNNEIEVMIGDEVPVKELKGNSVILAPYRVSDKLNGIIGVVGPARMDYSKVVSGVDFFAKQLEAMLGDRFDDIPPGIPGRKD